MKKGCKLLLPFASKLEKGKTIGNICARTSDAWMNAPRNVSEPVRKDLPCYEPDTHSKRTSHRETLRVSGISLETLGR